MRTSLVTDEEVMENHGADTQKAQRNPQAYL